MSVNIEHITAFRHDLQHWFRQVARDLPWRRSSDPYLIWISEIMLQQTRVDQAMPYFERFLATFPDVQTLASSSIDAVLREWEGLGYYSRARNLHKAAREIVSAHAGRFPDTVEAASSLPGVGPYTAAAVTSIAYGEPAVAVDGNVTRVIARVFGVEDNVSATSTRKAIRRTAQELLDPSAPGDFNESLMELGAMICSPRKPDCAACPLSEVCFARKHGMTELIPASAPRKPTPHWDVSVGIVRDSEARVLVVRRPNESLLGGLWEFPGARVADTERLEDSCRRGIREKLGLDVIPVEKAIAFDHQFSHFRITMHAFRCATPSDTTIPRSAVVHRWASIEDLTGLAMHKSSRRIADLVAGGNSGAA